MANTALDQLKICQVVVKFRPPAADPPPPNPEPIPRGQNAVI